MQLGISTGLVRYKGGASIPQEQDPYFANVTFLSNYTNSINDVKGNTVTAYGDANVSNGYLNLDGNGDFLIVSNSAGLDFNASSSFTIELIIKDLVNTAVALGSTIAPNDYSYHWVLLNNTGSIQLNTVQNNVPQTLLSGTPVATPGVDYHIAIVRDGGFTTLYVDGVNTSGVTTNWPTYSGAPLQIGTLEGPNANDINAKISAVRITQNVARYTTSFTPPTSFPEA